MLNVKLLRKDIEYVSKKLEKKGFSLDIQYFSNLEKKRKLLQKNTENLKSKHNIVTNLIKHRRNINQDFSNLKDEANIIIKELLLSQKELKHLLEKIKTFLIHIPNLPDDSIPNGYNSKDNIEINRWGEIRNFSFTIKDHVDIGNELGGFDWKAASKISGSRFVVMKGKIALLHRALGQFMIDIHTMHHGYLETYVPYLVSKKSLYGTGQLPKFSTDLFHIQLLSHQNENDNYVLIPTAEVPLTNLFQNCLLEESKLPIKLVANTPCFRSESSSYGSETRGLIRLHQFEKVEIVQIVHPKNSMEKLEQLTTHAEKILTLLELPYRKVLLCSRDIGFASSKTYDLEVWFPSKNSYREVSSCSNMLDFQARRIHARFRSKIDKKNYFVHTINGSGLAIGRTLAAILENYQQSDGRIKIPKILQDDYMHGLKFL
ncbi:seryl-tRNA synthetase [Buchnera aphidicola (Schlechtendalia chinensis)]|uniref:Serine--tRNA ligase n=1 Tax=Buchnera aphidicola subsp. Schlechtendalia chinensis TaxID=118110 RepID=A0A172WDL4_BUCSC|nr:serine--tRNA ligase [Buchnera aphidicola]ANF17069.1 seryl-tRNA synthetase [Buchnera aphidicola (Schlechtendalia chinensis)]